MQRPVSICVIGSRYVGLVVAVCFAEIGHRITRVDNDEVKLNIRQGGVPTFEQFISELWPRKMGSA